MDLFTYLMAKNGNNSSVHGDLFSYLLGKGQSQTQTLSGITIYIPDAKKTKIVELILDKESTQETTTGKNKITFDNITEETTLSIKKTFNINFMTLDGTTSGSGQIIPQGTSLGITLPAGTYTVAFKVKSGTYELNGDGHDIGFYFRDVNNTSLASIVLHNLSLDGSVASTSFSLSVSTEIYFYAYTNSSGIELNDLVIEAQIESGSTFTGFEEYTGGIPSPNPDYPQEVNTVKGYRNLTDIILDNSLNSTILFKTYNLKPNTQYLITTNTYIVSQTIANIFADAGTSFTPSTVSNGINGSKVITSDNNGNITIGYRNFDKLLDYSSGNYYVMLVEGTQEMPYVPYGNNYIYTKVIGKNLLEITNNNYLVHCSYVSGANTNQYKLLCTQSDMYVNELSNVGNSYNAVKNGNLISCNYGETIYFNTGNSLFNKNYFSEFDENLVCLGNYNKQTSSGTYTPTNVNCKYIILRFGYGTNSQAGTTYTLAPIICKISDTLYEPYQESITTIPLNNNEIVGIGIYKDELLVDKSGNVFINKKTGKVVLDGTENWEYYSTSRWKYRTQISNILPFTNSSSESPENVLCNYFTKTYWNNDNNNGMFNGFKDINTTISFANNSVTSLAEWKTWLGTHNTNVYYVLATEQLIDLQTKVDIRLFKGENTITNSEDCNMTIQYY